MRSLTTVLFILLWATSFSFAQQGEWYNDDGGFMFEGYGTENNPYIISSETALTYLAEKINSSSGETFDGKHFLLTNDLDLGKHYWTPIGSDPQHTFQGIFNGNGNTIRNLYIRRNEIQNFSATGLFGYVGNGAIIENLTIEGGKVYGSNNDLISRTGALAGYLFCNAGGEEDSIIIRNCHNIQVSVIGGETEYSHTGGLIGEGYAFCDSDGAVSIRIERCSNSGEVIASSSNFSYSGGIIGKGRGHGYCYGSVSAHGSFYIRSCTNNGTVTGGKTKGADAISSTGGILGFGYATGDGYGDSDGTGIFMIDYCMNTGAISGGDAVSSNAYTYVGGIFGYGDGYGYGDISGSNDNNGGQGYGSGTFSITSCANRGYISGGEARSNGTIAATGGIFGFASGSGAGNIDGYGYAYGSFSMRNCYSAANISAIQGCVGGLGGWIATSGNGPNYVISAIVQDSYVAGTINTDIMAYDQVISGGVIGRIQRADEANEAPKIDHCLVVLSHLIGDTNKTFRIAGQLENIKSPSKALNQNYAYIKNGKWSEKKSILNGHEWNGMMTALPVSKWNVSDRAWLIQENTYKYLPRLRNVPNQSRIVIP